MELVGFTILAETFFFIFFDNLFFSMVGGLTHSCNCFVRYHCHLFIFTNITILSALALVCIIIMVIVALANFYWP